MAISAEEGWTPSSLSSWKILESVEGTWAKCLLPTLPGHSLTLNQVKFPAWAVGSAQLFIYDNWSVGCLHLCCCCFLWKRWEAALESGNAALAGKWLFFLDFPNGLTRGYDFKAEVQEICLPGFTLTTSLSGLDQWPRQQSSSCRRLNRTMGEGRGFVGKEHIVVIQPASNRHYH